MRYSELRVVMIGAGITIGYFITRTIPMAAMTSSDHGVVLRTTIGAMTGGGLIGFVITPLVANLFARFGTAVDSGVKRVSAAGAISAAIGMIVGLIIANLLAIPVALIPYIGTYIGIGLNVSFGLMGLVVGSHKRDEIMALLSSSTRPVEHLRIPGVRDRSLKSYTSKACAKILDTSVIIDGRIADIADSGFIEGVMVIPSFVLEELQHIADSSDVLKRNRGRRGLDILNRMQKDEALTIEIIDKRIEDAEVDAKLIKLAQMMDAIILTNDFNLNKVAELHGVQVLNINELANALKPVVLPGEEMNVHVVKDGKEAGQGVAYLDDGTMVVVDGGKRHIGDSVGVLVTSVLQTSAGRMIFAKLKAADKAV